ncbi:transmembrane protein 26-like [Amphiura filiformis]|uniref:transmembrane protein 26-like n=1 Tax=Amphiura filiformis TaxID=82378 RepID=UPI003B21DC73
MTALFSKNCRYVKFFMLNVKAILARLLFATHGLVTIWRVSDVCDKKIFLLLCLPLGLLVIEMVVTTFYTKNGEWKWFCPSVFLYLASVIPGIWLLHMDLYQQRETYRITHGLEQCQPMMMFNETTLGGNQGISIPLLLPSDEWACGLQQIMFVLLIVGRWLLPKGQLSRDQLSQLLITHLGIAADSLEFSLETLDIGEVYCNMNLISAVLTIWTWSMLQFTLVRWSVSKGQQHGQPRGDDRPAKPTRRYDGCCGSEIWFLVLTVLLQDAPFLTMRLYLMLKYQVVNQMMLFFVVKNVLVICIQFYRVIILLCCPVQYYDTSIAMVGVDHEDQNVALVDVHHDVRQSRTLSLTLSNNKVMDLTYRLSMVEDS